MSQTQKALIFGGSKNIGYFSGLRLLEKGATVYYLLRRPSVFDNDEAMKKHIASGKAIIVAGDATSEENVRLAWETAMADGKPVDVVIFTVGGAPKFTGKGVTLDQPTLCTESMINVLSTMPRDSPPKIIGLSSIGITKRGLKSVPVLLKPVYKWMLPPAFRDKRGMETAMAYAAGWTWWTDEAPEGMLPEGWKSRLPESGFDKHVLLVRAAMLNDGESKGDSQGNSAYRVSEEELGGYSVSRKDVAHFVVEQALQDWEKFEGKVINVGY